MGGGATTAVIACVLEGNSVGASNQGVGSNKKPEPVSITETVATASGYTATVSATIFFKQSIQCIIAIHQFETK